MLAFQPRVMQGLNYIAVHTFQIGYKAHAYTIRAAGNLVATQG